MCGDFPNRNFGWSNNKKKETFLQILADLVERLFVFIHDGFIIKLHALISERNDFFFGHKSLLDLYTCNCPAKHICCNTTYQPKNS